MEMRLDCKLGTRHYLNVGRQTKARRARRTDGFDDDIHLFFSFYIPHPNALQLNTDAYGEFAEENWRIPPLQQLDLLHSFKRICKYERRSKKKCTNYEGKTPTRCVCFRA
ncbi:hypothetical protein ACLOJK_028466 [Asimina triloba]